jgi:hypothetical protein
MEDCDLFWVGPSIPARPRPAKDGQPYLEAKAFDQRETGDRMIGWGFLIPQQTFRSSFEFGSSDPTANRYPLSA